MHQCMIPQLPPPNTLSDLVYELILGDLLQLVFLVDDLLCIDDVQPICRLIGTQFLQCKIRLVYTSPPVSCNPPPEEDCGEELSKGWGGCNPDDVKT